MHKQFTCRASQYGRCMGGVEGLSWSLHEYTARQVGKGARQRGRGKVFAQSLGLQSFHHPAEHPNLEMHGRRGGLGGYTNRQPGSRWGGEGVRQHGREKGFQ